MMTTRESLYDMGPHQLERRSQKLAGEVVARVGEEATGIGRGDGLEGGTRGGDQTEEGALRRTAQGLLELGEGQFDRVEIGRIAGQEAQLTARSLDQPPRPRALVDGEVVQDDDLPRHQRGQQALLYIGLEGL